MVNRKGKLAEGTFGDRLKCARVAKGFTQKDLAEKLVLGSVAVVSNWEQNINKPSIDKLLDISSVLGVPTDYLLDCDWSGLSEDEWEIIQLYRYADDDIKNAVMTLVNRVATPHVFKRKIYSKKT